MAIDRGGSPVRREQRETTPTSSPAAQAGGDDLESVLFRIAALERAVARLERAQGE